MKTNGTTGSGPNTGPDDIRLYVITFGTITAATTTMMTNCASLIDGERLYYHAPTTSALADIFQKIGEDLSDLHLSM